jgi:hypothetical protein
VEPTVKTKTQDLGQDIFAVDPVEASDQPLGPRLKVNSQRGNFLSAFDVTEIGHKPVSFLYPENLFPPPLSVSDLEKFHAIGKIQAVVDMSDGEVVWVNMSPLLGGCEQLDQVHVGQI